MGYLRKSNAGQATICLNPLSDRFNVMQDGRAIMTMTPVSVTPWLTSIFVQAACGFKHPVWLSWQFLVKILGYTAQVTFNAFCIIRYPCFHILLLSTVVTGSLFKGRWLLRRGKFRLEYQCSPVYFQHAPSHVSWQRAQNSCSYITLDSIVNCAHSLSCILTINFIGYALGL